MASAVVMMEGEAIVYDLAFSGSNFYFQNWEKATMLKKKERDMIKAVEQLESTQIAWNKKDAEARFYQ